MLTEIANALDVTLSYLLGIDSSPAPTSDGFIEVPLYGSIAAGTPIEMLPTDDMHPIPVIVRDKYPDAFLLKVRGESMNRVLPNGCYALIDPAKTVERDGKPYAVCVNGYDATIKRVRKLANGYELAPDSNDPTYRAQVYDYGIEGTDEWQVCLGDQWQIGNARFEVSQGRQPCWKLNERFGVPDIAAQVQHNLRCGWYLRVLQSGRIQAGDSVQLLARSYAEWPLSRILELIDSRNCQPQAMREVLQLPLPPSWQHMFQRRLDTGECEDWQRRLFG